MSKKNNQSQNNEGLKTNLHLILKGKSFDGIISQGNITLKKASNFMVSIKEFDEEYAKVKKIWVDGEKFARDKYNTRAKQGWSQKELDDNYNAKMDDTKQKYEPEAEKLWAKYKNLNWAWVLATHQVKAEELRHNETFAKGITEDGVRIDFPEILEGGGMAYLEAFPEGVLAKGKAPFGMLVQAVGSPRIIRVEWTDFEYNSLKGKIIKYGSEVLLHVYTRALYGQEISISLLDKDTFTGNDLLSIGGRNAFEREVNIAKVLPFEDGKDGVDDSLLKTEQSHTDGVPETEKFIQKVTVKVKVEDIWKMQAGNLSSNNYLKIFPQIKSIKTDAFFENFTREYLEVSEYGQEIFAPASFTNNPAMVGEISTNVRDFHPCKYTEIGFNIIPETEKEKNRTIFKEERSVEKPAAYNIPIICPDIDHLKDYAVELKNVETKDCSFDGKPNDHEISSINILEIPENYKIIRNDGKILNFKAAFNYHPSNDNLIEKTSIKMLEYIWPVSLPRDNKQALELIASSCRYAKNIKVLAYPDVKWTLDFRFGMKGPEQYASTGLPTYPRTKDPEAKNPQSRYSDAFAKGNKAGRINTYGMEKRENGMELEFQLVLKAEYNKGEEIELAAKYAQKIKKFLELLLKLKEGLDKLTNIDKVNSGHKSAVRGLGNFLKSPIIGTIDYPAISVGGKWQAAIREETNEVYTDGKLALRFNPLLKGDVSLDIIAAVSYVPAFGQAVKAIEIALNTVGAELNFLLTVFGQINVEFEYALAEKGGSNLNLNGELGIKLVLSGRVKISLNAVVFSINGEIQAEAYAVTSVKPKAGIGHDSKGTYVEAKCDFMGINIVCIITTKGKNNQIQYKDTYNILDRKDDFVNGRGYIIES